MLVLVWLLVLFGSICIIQVIREAMAIDVRSMKNGGLGSSNKEWKSKCEMLLKGNVVDLDVRAATLHKFAEVRGRKPLTKRQIVAWHMIMRKKCRSYLRRNSIERRKQKLMAVRM